MSALRTSLQHDRSRFVWAAGLVAAGALVWSAWVEPRRLATRRESLRLPGWPQALEGLRVGVLADLHAGAPPVGRRRLERVVEALRATEADLVLVPGDFVDADALLGGRLSPEEVAGSLRRLDAPLGVFGVLGNHDRGFDGARVTQAAAAVGVRMLENDAARVEVRGAPLWVAGFADVASGTPLIERALERIPEGEPVLAVTHSPDVFPRVPRRVSLTIAGHTHAGQVNLPLVRRLAIPSRFGERYAEGHIEEEGRHLFVDRGVGTSKLPVRLGARPQVTLLKLHTPVAGPAGGG